jgi:hypothetical protein
MGQRHGTHIDEAVVEEEAEHGGAGAGVVHDGLRHDLAHHAFRRGAARGVEPRRELRVGAPSEEQGRRRQEQRRRPRDGHSRLALATVA